MNTRFNNHLDTNDNVPWWGVLLYLVGVPLGLGLLLLMASDIRYVGYVFGLGLALVGLLAFVCRILWPGLCAFGNWLGRE